MQLLTDKVLLKQYLAVNFFLYIETNTLEPCQVRRKHKVDSIVTCGEGENRSVVGVVGVRGGRCFKAFKKVDLSGTTDFYFDSE